ncbi:MAG: hypothetical protein P8R42_06225 [Candidatus Binatia bacterium]|nr:hypothetical protein [Candidatus Binatia bacterium]
MSFLPTRSAFLAVFVAASAWLAPERAHALLENNDPAKPQSHYISEESDIGYVPGYASGNDYSAFTATIEPARVDNDQDSQKNDERCESFFEAPLTVAAEAFAYIGAGSFICDALPSDKAIPPTCLVSVPLAQEICNAVLAGAALAAEAEAIALAQCEYQGGAVDGAEIEAAYENTRHIIAIDLEQRLGKCDKVMSLVLGTRPPETPVGGGVRFGGRAEEVRELVRVRLDQYESAMTDNNALTNDANTILAFTQASNAFMTGSSLLAGGQLRDAYLHFCRAYERIANTGP